MQTENQVQQTELAFEFMMNALRLTDGFDISLFSERTGLPITAIQPQLNQAEQQGLITRDHIRITPTDKGQRFLNDLLGIFLPTK